MYQQIYLPVDQSKNNMLHVAQVVAAVGGAFGVRVLGATVQEQDTRRRRLRRLQDGLAEAGGALARDTASSLAATTEDLAPAGLASPVDADALATVRQAILGAGLTFEERTARGRPLEALLADITASSAELVTLGGGGEGRTQHVSGLCERLLRHARVDALVVRQNTQATADGRILVCVDGSRHSYGGLITALEIGRRLGRAVEAVGVYDPYLHYTLFNGIVNVLSAEASKVFKFKDQEKLHEEIIDTGLAKIYQAHLEVARKVAADAGVELGITLLDGKAHQKILQYARKTKPWLLVMGRIGVHSDEDMDLGATTENLLRSAPCHLLVSSQTHQPPIDVEAEASIEWTPQAKRKMDRVPGFVRGVATTAILRWAMERGHSVITPAVINSAMGDLLPPGAAQAMGYVAEEVAISRDDLTRGKTFVCPECGHAVRDVRPRLCIVCKNDGAAFEMIDREAIEKAGKLSPGDLETEDTFDGVRLSWTVEAKQMLRRVPTGYDRRRTKARIEKNARIRGLKTISGAFAEDMVEQEIADTSYLSDRGERVDVAPTDTPSTGPDDRVAQPREQSPLPWTDAAWQRICRVPEGFMRDMTREKVEEVAADRAAAAVDLALCEEGIVEGRRMMAEALKNYKRS